MDLALEVASEHIHIAILKYPISSIPVFQCLLFLKSNCIGTPLQSQLHHPNENRNVKGTHNVIFIPASTMFFATYSKEND